MSVLTFGGSEGQDSWFEVCEASELAAGRCGLFMNPVPFSQTLSLHASQRPPSLTVCVPTDPNILDLSGKVLPSCDLARRYGLRDIDGKQSLWASFS